MFAQIFGLPWYIYLPLLALSIYLMRHKRPYLKGPDSVFVSGDPWNVVVVHAILTTKSPVPYDFFRKVVDEKIASIPHFRQKIIKRKWRWHYFQTDEAAFDLNHQIKTHDLELPKGADTKDPMVWQEALEAYTSKLIQTPINMKRPPWEFILVPKYDKGSAIIFRVHHAIADGITLMRIAMSIFQKRDDELSGSTLTVPKPTGVAGVSSFNATPSPSPEASSPQQQKAALTGTFRALAKFKKVKAPPIQGTWNKIRAFQKALDYIIKLKPDPVSLIKPATNITPHVPCHAKWLRHPLCLSELKQVAYATGASVNDILFYIVSSGIRSFMLAHGQHPETIHNARTVMWVSLQGTDVVEKIDFGNHIGAVTIPFPLSEKSRLARLKHIQSMTNNLTVSPEPIVAYWLLNLLGLVPAGVMAPVWNALAYKPSNSMSNVPGPQYPVTWGKGGAELERMVFFVPPQGTIASFITILSYNNQVQMGFLSDSRICDAPGEVIDLFEREYEGLKKELDQLQKAGKLQAALGLRDEDKQEL